MTPTVVSNSSPLIALDQIGQLSILKSLFQTITVPPAVVREVTPLLALPSWIAEQNLSRPVPPEVVSTKLGPGEQEVLALAHEAGAARVVLDDRAARSLAGKLGLNVIGTLGILLAGKRRAFIPAVLPYLDDLKSKGFYMGDELYTQVRIAAGE